MTYKELKDQIRDLGFEEDASMDEYKEIVINSCNRAISIILKTVVSKIEGYFKFENAEWKFPTPTLITIDTANDNIIDLPDKVIDLVPLLAAYYVWLDDDERKAVYYYNQYDDLKNQILAECQGGSKARIVGGVRF